MRRITFKIIILVAIAISFAVIIDILSLNTKTAPKIAKLFGCEEYLEEGSGLKSVGGFIDGVRTDDSTDCLVIGDSIAGQFFGSVPHNDDVHIQCANAAICITGQYMLAMEWLRTHENAKEIYLFMHPTSLTRTHDTEWTYPYVVIPFGTYDLLGYLDKETIKDMESVYGALFMKRSVIKLINDSPLNRKLYLNYLKNSKTDFEQIKPFDISEQYIKKLADECDKRNVRFYLLPTPSSDYQKNTIDGLVEAYEQSDLFFLFPDYLRDIYYFSNDYSNDYQHLAPEYATREYMDEIIKKAYTDSGEELLFLNDSK